MLQRHVDIFDDLGQIRDGVEQLGGNEIRIAVEQSYAAQIVNRREIAQQLCQRRGRVEVAAVGGQILRDQVDLAHTAGDEIARLGDKVGGRAALMKAANLRDDAKG